MPSSPQAPTKYSAAYSRRRRRSFLPSFETMTVTPDIVLQPGTLLPALRTCTQSALASGALQPILTDEDIVEDGGVRFLVRVVSTLRSKEADRRCQASVHLNPVKPANPFLPPERGLTVADISRTHLAILNKFHVLERHLLIVTRAFEHQEALLTLDDFQALFVCMAEYPGLGFYNAGATAGASQPHKHLQLVPLFPVAGRPGVPMESLLYGAGPRCPNLPFAHAFGRLSVSPAEDPLSAASEGFALYRHLLLLLGISAVQREGESRQSAPYNLLVARDWMLAVPRAQECYRTVSVNALGFAGSLFVKDAEQLETIRAAGPMNVLKSAAGHSS
jgi:sulfate adenylyltransferase (ADP) / ATP adenylyltransferase